MVPIGLADELEFAPATRSRSRAIRRCRRADNLVVRALDRHRPRRRAARGDAAQADPGRRRARRRLERRGGGAARRDGGRARRRRPARLARRRARARLRRPVLPGRRHRRLVEGTGERVTALGHAPPWWVVLAVPPVARRDRPGVRAARASARRAVRAPTRPRSDSASLRCGEALQRGDYAARARRR